MFPHFVSRRTNTLPLQTKTDIRGAHPPIGRPLITPKPIRFENHSQKNPKKATKGKVHGGVHSNRLGIVPKKTSN
jgi:hypothetical protein